jgi:hypothetical protein
MAGPQSCRLRVHGIIEARSNLDLVPSEMCGSIGLCRGDVAALPERRNSPAISLGVRSISCCSFRMSATISMSLKATRGGACPIP